jgi:hypothetical protein
MRAGKYTHRLSHLDSLHLDVRFDSAETVTDAGSFAYNAPPPWNNGLAASRVHNGPMLDDAELASRGQRFLWYSWPAAQVVAVTYDAGVATLIGEIPGRVRREVVVRPTGVNVRDTILDPSALAGVRKAFPVQSSHTFSTESAVFDERNLVSAGVWFRCWNWPSRPVFRG